MGNKDAKVARLKGFYVCNFRRSGTTTVCPAHRRRIKKSTRAFGRSRFREAFRLPPCLTFDGLVLRSQKVKRGWQQIDKLFRSKVFRFK